MKMEPILIEERWLQGNESRSLSPSVIHMLESTPLLKDLHANSAGSYLGLKKHQIHRPRGKSDALFIYCIEGEGYGTVENFRHNFRKGDAMFFPPHREHSYGTHPQNPWKIHWIHFNGLQLNEYFRMFEVGNEKWSFHLPDVHSITVAFFEFYQHMSRGISRSDFFVTSTHLARFLAIINLQRSSLDQRLRSSDEGVHQTIKYLQQHPEAKMNLEKIARMAGLSVTHYSALFRRKTGMAPMEYFICLKIQRACSLLDSSSHQIQEIARLVGYEDPYYFSRIFKKIMKKSPAQYRKILKG